MTTRGQKKTSDTVACTTSDSGVVIDMLTAERVEPVVTQNTTISQTVPAVAKDVTREKGKESEISSTLTPENKKQTSPAKAKDGEHSK